MSQTITFHFDFQIYNINKKKSNYYYIFKIKGKVWMDE